MVRSLFRVTTCTALGLILGCAPTPTKPPLTFTQAEQKFQSLCLDELKTACLTRKAGTTLYVYVPTENTFLLTRAAKDPQPRSNEYSEAPVINYVDSQFNAGNFQIEYDIVPARKYPSSNGYASNYTEEFQRLQQNLLSALNRSFADSSDKEDERIEFMIVLIADLVNGVEIESIFSKADLMHGLSPSQSLAQEEFYKRYITQLKGDEKIVGDKLGEHVNFAALTWGEFLAKQITNRVNFKYQRSSHPPTPDTLAELQRIVIETLDAYDFTEYSGVSLANLADKTSIQYTPAEINLLKSELSVSSGKFHTIKFQ